MVNNLYESEWSHTVLWNTCKPAFDMYLLPVNKFLQLPFSYPMIIDLAKSCLNMYVFVPSCIIISSPISKNLLASYQHGSPGSWHTDLAQPSAQLGTPFFSQ